MHAGTLEQVINFIIVGGTAKHSVNRYIVLFHYCSLGGVTAMPGRLHARLCHAFLVTFICTFCVMSSAVGSEFSTHFAPGWGTKYCDEYCMSVCLSARITRNHTAKLHRIFMRMLRPPLTALRYVTNFQFNFVDDVILSYHCASGLNQAWRGV